MYELCFGEAYYEYSDSYDFSRENTNIDVSVYMFDLRMINMSSECEYDWYWKISTCSTEYEVCDSFASFTRHPTSYSGSAGWYLRYQSIHIQITYTYPTRGEHADHYTTNAFKTWPKEADMCQFPQFERFNFSFNFNAVFYVVIILMGYWWAINKIKYFILKRGLKGFKFKNFAYLKGM